MNTTNTPFKPLRALAAAIFLFAAGASTAAEVHYGTLTFEDVSVGNGTGVLLANGYKGLNWVNFSVLNTTEYSSNPSGYQTLAQSAHGSPTKVGYNGGGSQAAILAASGNTFSVARLGVCAAWNQGLTVRFRGFRNGVVVPGYDQQFIVNSDAPQTVTLNYLAIDQLLIDSSGGTDNPAYPGNGQHVTLDNIVEPSYANYIYHERTGNDVTGGAANTCGGAQAYVPVLNPTSAQSYLLRFKVEYQSYTDRVRVYYTTDGSNPSGAFGVPGGTTAVVSGSYQCTFTFGGNTIDVCNATIPAQPAGTVVRYIIGAWNSGGASEIFANSGTCGGCGDCESSTCATVFQYTVSSATELYWDKNGSTAGAGGATPTGTWGTDNFWSSTFDGTSTTGGWAVGQTAVFSAGSDATGDYTVTVSGTQTAAGMVVEEGTVNLAVGTVSIGTGDVTVNSGAVLSTDSSARIAANSGATITLNGGTLRTTNPGAAGSFVDVDFAITLGAAGGKFSHAVANVLNIVQTTTTVIGPGSLTKEGVGVLAIAGTCSYDGSTIINDGELRIRTSANRLPVNTAVVINNPGILNLNGVAQQIGSLAGNGTVGIAGTSSQTLTVGDASSTVFSGVISNIANAGAGGGTTGIGRLVKVGSGSLTLSGANYYSGGTVISNGTLVAANTTGSATGSSNVLVTVNGTLAGSGSVSGTVTNFGTLSPGVSPGDLSTGSEIWNGGGSYRWEINDATGSAGADPGWDHLTINGTLTIAATPANRFNLLISPLVQCPPSSFITNLDNTLDYTWTIATASGGIVGFDPTAFNLAFFGPCFDVGLLGDGFFLVGTNQSGTSIEVRFVHKPSIVTPPAGLNAECGSSNTFSVTATGTPPLSFQWRLNESPIEGATAASYTMNPTTPTDAGGYTVVVTNLYGSVTSSVVAQLEVVDTTPPVINCPTNMVVLAAEGQCDAVVNYTVTATDGCDATPVVTCVPPSGSTLSVGRKTVLCTAMDSSGNSTTCSFTVSVYPSVAVPAGANWTPHETSRSWTSIASSADGAKLVAVDRIGSGSSGRIYTSIDSGGSWIARETSRHWHGVASSEDGNKLVAVTWGGKIYISTDGGTNWAARASDRLWHSVASSADGNRLVAVVYGGQVYTSTDSGVTWAAHEANRNWDGVACSADGTKLVGSVLGGQIFTSTDSGTNWTVNLFPADWRSVASAADGSKLAAVNGDGLIYTSADFGSSWTAHGSWTYGVLVSVAASADGNKLVTVAGGGRIYISTDSGMTWTAREGDRSWACVTSSADGDKLAAAVEGGLIYTSVSATLTLTNPPTILGATNQVIEATGPGGAVANFTITATNVCQPSVPVTCTPPSGSLFPLGTNTVTCVAVDALDQTNTATFTVTVRDTTPPFINCGQNETVSCWQGWGFTVPIVTDSGSGVASVIPLSTVTNLGCGYTFVATRVWLATDVAGNSTTCTQVVTTVDFIHPTITFCPEDQILHCLSEVPAPNPGLVVATNEFDPCETTSPVIVHFLDVTNGVDPLWITRIYRAYDSCSNFADCYQTFTVPAPVPPVVEVPPHSQTNLAGASATLSVSVAGCGPMAFQWRKDGEPLFSSTTTTLEVTGLRVWDAGDYDVVVTNTGGSVTSAVATLTVICPNIAVNGTPPPSVLVGQGIMPFQFTAYSEAGSANLTIFASGLPPGLYAFPSGSMLTVSGTSSVPGTYDIFVTAQDMFTGCGASQVYTQVVECPPFTFSPETLPDASPTQAYAQTFTVSYPAQMPGDTIGFALVSGSLPPGLSLDNDGTLTGSVSGPAVTYQFILSVTNLYGCLGTNAYSITVNSLPPPAISQPPNVANGSFTVSYSGAPGVQYAIEYRENLGQGPWQNFTNVTASPTGEIVFTAPVTAAPMRFFRAVPAP